VKIVVFTGAGISAPSGISTFRDVDGLWENHKIDDVANYLTWRQNFQTIHDFYNQRRQDIKTKNPNPAHFVIKEIQETFDDVIVYTQNIDDLFEKADVDVIHLHGFINQMKCVACGNVWDFHDDFDAGYDTCPKCGSKKGVKPNVVFFHENAPNYPSFYKTINSLTKDDVFIIIGTSGVVIDVDSLTFDNDAYKILVNLKHEDVINNDYFNEVYFGDAVDVMPLVLENIRKIKNE
jgi:NAD-dependent deacetylase